MSKSTTFVSKPPVRAIDEDFPHLSTHRISKHRFIEVPEDPTPKQRMLIVESSGSLDFWDDPEEDVYSADDGDEL